jgi:hypothetical protein
MPLIGEGEVVKILIQSQANNLTQVKSDLKQRFSNWAQLRPGAQWQVSRGATGDFCCALKVYKKLLNVENFSKLIKRANIRLNFLSVLLFWTNE